MKIGIKSLKDVLEDAKEVMKNLNWEKKLNLGLYFESIEGFRKALTPRGLSYSI